MLIALIVACEIGFWVVLGAGLAARYLLRWRRTGAVLLWCVPLVDVVLLVASIVDLRRGAPPSAGHGLAAAYIGFSVAFGHRMIRWADEHVAHRFAGGPAPGRPPKAGRARAVYEWRLFGLAALAVAVAAALLGAGALLVGGGPPAEPLLGWITRLSTVLAFWFVLGPLWQEVSALAPPAGSPGRRDR